jgi:hypothetical protein
MSVTKDTVIEQKSKEEKAVAMPEYDINVVMEDAEKMMHDGWLTSDIVGQVTNCYTKARELMHRSITQKVRRTVKRSLEMGDETPRHTSVPQPKIGKRGKPSSSIAKTGDSKGK